MTTAHDHPPAGPEWAEWYAAQCRIKGNPSFHIPSGMMCSSCRRQGEHELMCRNPWSVKEIQREESA